MKLWIACCRSRLGRHKRRVRRQTHNFFRELAIELSGRQKKSIGEVVIHGVQTGGARITHPAGLHGRRFTGEGQQAIFAGVARQVDQDVDAVIADSFGQRGVRQTGNRVPVRQIPAQALGDSVFDSMIVVGVQ